MCHSLSWIIVELANMEKQQQSFTLSSHLHHRISPFDESNLKLDWQTLHSVGIGLDNTDSIGICANRCYINAIIQCLAVTPPFVQLLLNDDSNDQCE